MLGSSPRVRGTRDALAIDLAGSRFIPARAGNSALAELAACLTAVHPRACGELPGTLAHCARYCGSSPRVRGTPGTYRGSDHKGRFIPARAGNSEIRPAARAHRSVHPRACGELVWPRSVTCVVAGSSPRVRGTPWSRGIACTPNRFIPACAGNSPAHPGSSRGLPVHPRACGELVIVRAFPQADFGSSPRVRGTPWPTMAPSARSRFIPARAGNSRTSVT